MWDLSHLSNPVETEISPLITFLLLVYDPHNFCPISCIYAILCVSAVYNNSIAFDGSGNGYLVYHLVTLKVSHASWMSEGTD